MTEDTRGAVADLALLGVAAIAVYFIATNPPLRRVAWRVLKYGVFSAAPRVLWHETTQAWATSAIPDSDSRV